MEKKIKNYNVLPSTSDVYAISLVEEPAVESNFIALSKQDRVKNFTFSENGEKRMLYGVALRADFPIYRYIGNEEFYLTFSKDAVRRLMTKFMKNHMTQNWTLDHLDFAEGLTVVESWIVENVENDKSSAIGLENVSEGSWIVGCKVDDDETWQSIKEGRWNGFSVEAWVDYSELNNKENNDTQMAKKKSKFDELIERIKDIIADAVEDAEGQNEETVEEVVEEAAEAVEEVVEENESTVVENEDETPAETPEEVAEEVVETVEENADTEEEAAEDLQTVVDALNEEISALRSENEEMKKKIAKMSKQPSVNPVKGGGKGEKPTNPVQSVFASLKAQGFMK